jgi:hypothetical protein
VLAAVIVPAEAPTSGLMLELLWCASDPGQGEIEVIAVCVVGDLAQQLEHPGGSRGLADLAASTWRCSSYLACPTIVAGATETRDRLHYTRLHSITRRTPARSLSTRGGDLAICVGGRTRTHCYAGCQATPLCHESSPKLATSRILLMTRHLRSCAPMEVLVSMLCAATPGYTDAATSQTPNLRNSLR